MRARIIRDLEGNSDPPRPELIGKARSDHLRAILSAETLRDVEPGRGSTRNVEVPGDDPILADMRDFAQATLKQLHQGFRSGAFQRLALLARRRMLALLFEEMPSDLEHAIILAGVRDLVCLEETELRRRVSAILAARGAIVEAG